jgi:hypothetical protein
MRNSAFYIKICRFFARVSSFFFSLISSGPMNGPRRKKTIIIRGDVDFNAPHPKPSCDHRPRLAPPIRIPSPISMASFFDLASLPLKYSKTL